MIVARCAKRFLIKRCHCRRSRTLVGCSCLASASRAVQAISVAVWEDLAEAFDRLADVDIDVIIDCGRFGQAGPPRALLERCALTAVVLNATLRSVMSARVHLPVLRDHPRLNSKDRGHLGLIVIGEGQPYGRSEIAKVLDVPVITSIAHDPQTAVHFSDGTTATPTVRLLPADAQHS